MTSFRILVCLFCLTTSLRAQSVSPLNRLITLNISNEPLEQALTAISRAGQFSFSYNPALLQQRQPVTLRVASRPVREVLAQLLGNGIRVRARGNHVILLQTNEPEQPKSFVLDGYVIDRETSERIGAASIFERTSLRSVNSNDYGYYRLKLPASLSLVRLEVRRQDYQNQSLTVSTRRSQPQPIYLTVVPSRITAQPSVIDPLDVKLLPIDTATLTALSDRPVLLASVDSMVVPMPSSLLERSRQRVGRWALSTKQLITNINLDRDTLYRTWQVSFVPGIGSNRLLGGRIINDYSINILAGYSLGVRKMELGGFLNMVHDEVYGFQAAGFGNLAGGNTQGVQLAGFTNVVGGRVQGVQLAGFLNTIQGEVQGVQLAGFLNANLKTTTGFQAAGFANIVGDSVRGVQLAGFTNIVRGPLSGWQVSGFINVAGHVRKGHQLGFINVARSSESAPIGFFSYVHENGYRNAAISTNEVTTANATFRTGVRSFYNIFTAGLNPGKDIWSFGYGLGTTTTDRRGWSLALEAIMHQLNPTTRGIDNTNLLLRLSPVVMKRFGGRVGLSVGPTLNAYYSDNALLNPLLNQSLPALVVSPDTPGNNRDLWTGWIGWEAGLRYALQKI
ncbi:MAG: STN domain-containing protein [Spirosoma sp.]|nr:STN domain-containing protein [Spirosoma sp.]